MRTRNISRVNFDKLVERFRTKERYGEERVRIPYETDEEYQKRLEDMKKPPVSLIYYGRFHIIQFLPK